MHTSLLLPGRHMLCVYIYFTGYIGDAIVLPPMKQCPNYLKFPKLYVAIPNSLITWGELSSCDVMASADLNPDASTWKIETGLQMMARLGVTRTNLDVESKLFPLGLIPGSIMEVHGEEGCGKTELLLALISRCIMPTEWRSAPTEGLGIGVIYVDTDQHFSISRLESIIEKRLRRSVSLSQGMQSDYSDRQLEEEVESCLSNFKYASCYSSKRLKSILQVVREMVVNDCSLCLVIVDSLSAFYWEDRMMNTESANAFDRHYSHLADIMGKIAVDHKASIIFTTHPLMNETRRGDSAFYLMGQDIKKLLNFRLKMSRKQDGSGGRSVMDDFGNHLQTTVEFTFTDVGIVFT